MKHLLTFILAFLSLGLAVQMVSCSGQEAAPTKTYFTDAFFYGLQEGDTIDLGNSSDTAVSLRLFYGCGVLDVYRAFVSWKSSDTDVVKTHKGLSTIKEDSCYSLCALSPGGKAGTVDVAVTMQFSTSQRTLHFVVKTDYSRKKWGLPEGSFDDTISVGSIVKDAIITMVFVKADTLYTTGGEEGRQMLIDSGPDNIRVQGYRIHSRYLKDYYISQTEVTNQLWENVMGEKSFSAASGRDKPVRLASYWEVQNFLQRLNEITGRHYRLPWEAEWEFAARGGRMRKGYLYAGSDYLNEVALHVDNSRLSDGMLSPQPVASKKPNELKLYDMMGNVEEWCLDTTRLTMDEYVVRFGGGYQLLWRSRRRRGGSYKSSPYSRLWHWLEYTIHGDSDGSRPYLNIVRLAYNTDSATQAQCMATILADAEEKISQKESTRCGFRLALSVEEE